MQASHDGADSSSITSGMDNETKKPTTNFSKMKKSSIKRKVQHLSHESDDGIIEPLLQTDKEKSEIANRSAKFLLNKSKTESLHEKDNKATGGYAETCSVSIPISSTSNMITNNVKQSPITTSYVCGSAPIHNHMNSNIFSAYDSSTGMTTTKSPILVEIDNTKSRIYSPSPLIFTTAKIHIDSKTKLMEPVQVTSVPILSTVEGNIIKAGIVNNTETTRNSGSSMTPTDHMKVLSGKYEENNVSQPYTRSDPFSTVSHPNTTVKTESHSLENSANLLNKDEKCQFSNTISNPKVGSDDFKALKEQPTRDVVSNTRKNISESDIVKQPIELSKSSATSTSEKYSLLDKETQSFRNLNNKDNKILQAPIDSQNQINTHSINLKSSDNQKSISNEHVNSSDLSNKKLQRQTKILSEATNDAMGKIMKTQNTQNLIENKEKNISKKSDKEVTSKVDHKNPIATKDSSKIISSIAQTTKGTLCTTLSTEIKAIPSSVSASTSKEKSFTESINSKPALIGGIKDVSKPLASVASTAQLVRDSKESTIISTNAAVSPLTSTKVTTTSVRGKPNVVPSLYSSSQSIKTEPSNSIVTVINTTLPSYIVSTSKTKIGSTLTCNTSAIASKSQMQKPLVNVSTASAQVKSFETPTAKSAPSTSVVNGTKNTKFSKQTKSQAETIKKDGRA